jgi:hypothetical protein
MASVIVACAFDSNIVISKWGSTSLEENFKVLYFEEESRRKLVLGAW